MNKGKKMLGIFILAFLTVAASLGFAAASQEEGEMVVGIANHAAG